MPKRKAGFSSQNSKRSRSTIPSSAATSSQPIRRSSRLRKPSQESTPATVVDVGNDNIGTSGSPLISNPQAADISQRFQFTQSHALDVDTFWDLAAEPFFSSHVCPLGDGENPAEASEQSTGLAYTPVRGSRPTGGIPQMTYERYQALLRSLGHVKGTRGPLKNMPKPPNLVGNNLGPRSDKKTDFRPDQAEYSIDNLPEIIYAFEQPDNYYGLSKLKEPPSKSYTIHGEEVRDIPILPDRISPDPEGWLYEYWSRMDPRIRYDKDIAPRIRPDLRPAYPTRFSMSRRRFRADCQILGWVVRGKIFEKSRNEILSAAAKAGIDVEGTNSTRGLSWGLIDPRLGELGGRIDVPDSLRPKNTRADGPTGGSVPVASGSSYISNEDAQRTHQQYQVIPTEDVLPQTLLPQTFTAQALSSSKETISGARDSVAEAPTSIQEIASPVQTTQSQTTRSHNYDAMPQSSIAVFQDPYQRLKHWGTARLDTRRFPMHDLVQNHVPNVGPQPVDVLRGLPYEDFMHASRLPYFSSSSQTHIPNVYEGYAKSNEMFVQDLSGTYVPVTSTEMVPLGSNTFPSLSASFGIKSTPATAHQGSIYSDEVSKEDSIYHQVDAQHLSDPQRTAHTLQQLEFSQTHHREHNFYQRDEILHQAAKCAIEHNLDKPSEDATAATNMLVEEFYTRDNLPLLNTIGPEWESTRSDFVEFSQRVESNPVYFHEYFPLLIRDVRDYARKILGEPWAGSRTTLWPDSRVPAERELYNTVWNFERRRWNHYTKSSSLAEPF